MSDLEDRIDDLSSEVDCLESDFEALENRHPYAHDVADDMTFRCGKCRMDLEVRVEGNDGDARICVTPCTCVLEVS